MKTVCQDMRARMSLMQQLSVAMQHGIHAACILGRIAYDAYSSDFLKLAICILIYYLLFAEQVSQMTRHPRCIYE